MEIYTETFDYYIYDCILIILKNTYTRYFMLLHYVHRAFVVNMNFFKGLIIIQFTACIAISDHPRLFFYPLDYYIQPIFWHTC